MRLWLLLLIPALALTACSNARETFGLNSAAPDEFAVVDHPPLSMPPDFALHPPKPGEAPFQSVQPSQQAAQALYGKDAMARPVIGSAAAHPTGPSAAEQALLTNAGKSSDPNIRDTVDHESTQQVVGSRKLIDAVLFWREPKKEPSTVVDPVAERKRIEDAKKKQQPITTGATPVIGAKKDGTVGTTPVADSKQTSAAPAAPAPDAKKPDAKKKVDPDARATPVIDPKPTNTTAP